MRSLLLVVAAVALQGCTVYGGPPPASPVYYYGPTHRHVFAPHHAPRHEIYGRRTWRY